VNMFREGDIAGCKAGIRQLAFNKLITPFTDRWHFLLIGEKLFNGDHVIYESLAKGVCPGRLSFYWGEHLKVYRVPDKRKSLQAVEEASELGRLGYDYILFVWMFWQALFYWTMNGPGKIPYWALKQDADRNVICTELVCQCFQNAGYPLVPRDIIPTPAAIEQANLNGKIEKIFEGVW